MTKSHFPEVAENRSAAYEIDPVFLNRWSPRSFKEDQVPDDVLFSLFEAARWAPSASNEQPWRFIVPGQRKTNSGFIRSSPKGTASGAKRLLYWL